MSAKKAESRSRGKGSSESMSRKQLISAGAVAVAVVGTLLLGAALQSDSEPDVTVELPEPTDIEIGETALDILPVEESPAPATAVDRPDERQRTPAESRPPVTPRGADPLAERGAADLQRLRSRGGEWTLQFASMCDPERVAALLGSLERHESFFLVPAGDCYRLWWGRYRSRDQAVAAGDVPAELDSIPENPFPRRIAEALP